MPFLLTLIRFWEAARCTQPTTWATITKRNAWRLRAAPHIADTQCDRGFGRGWYQEAGNTYYAVRCVRQRRIQNPMPSSEEIRTRGMRHTVLQ